VNEKGARRTLLCADINVQRQHTMSQSFSPEYLAEDISAPLLGTSIAFIVLETTVMALMYASRYYAKGERANLWMEAFMTMTYLVCQGKITVAICKACPDGWSRGSADDSL
jgi:hypothetical protein